MSARLLHFHIGRRYLASLAMIVGGTALTFFLVNYIDALRRFGDEPGFGSLAAAQLSALELPETIEQLLSFAFLFASLITLTRLAQSMELAVVRAGGVSVWSFLAAPVGIAVACGVLSTTLLNPVAVLASARHDLVSASLSGGRGPPDAGLWFRQRGASEAAIIHAGGYRDDGRFLVGLTVFAVDLEGKFLRKITARTARLQDGSWRLNDVSVVARDNAEQRLPTYDLPTELDANAMAMTVRNNETPSFWALPSRIALVERDGRRPDEERLAFNQLLSRPLFFAAMLMVAACVSLRFNRRGAGWRLMLAGVAGGFLLYFIGRFFGDLGANSIIDPVSAAWLPSILGLSLGATALLHQEDG